MYMNRILILQKEIDPGTVFLFDLTDASNN
jgi:hypothetical protein